jgi:hypothetical protein
MNYISFILLCSYALALPFFIIFTTHRNVPYTFGSIILIGVIFGFIDALINKRPIKPFFQDLLDLAKKNQMIGFPCLYIINKFVESAVDLKMEKMSGPDFLDAILITCLTSGLGGLVDLFMEGHQANIQTPPITPKKKIAVLALIIIPILVVIWKAIKN